MNPEIQNQLRTEAKRATTLSRKAVEAMKAGNFEVSQTLIKDAAIAGRKCQILLHENQSTRPTENLNF